jgi:hypothetical protein
MDPLPQNIRNTDLQSQLYVENKFPVEQDTS